MKKFSSNFKLIIARVATAYALSADDPKKFRQFLEIINSLDKLVEKKPNE